MNDAVLRTIPRAYFDQAQHMLRYAPHLSHKYNKAKQRFGWGATQRPGEKSIEGPSGERFQYFPEWTKDKALRILASLNNNSIHKTHRPHPIGVECL